MEKQSNTQNWTRGKSIGKGCFGTVSLAIDETNGAVFAVKSVELATCLPNQLECLENEIRILRSFSSPYVVKYLGDDVTPATSNRNLHVEFMPGGTVAELENVKRLSADVDERLLRWQTRCLVSGLKYVHGEGIVHCDVKGRNVLLGHNSTSVKLADFGSAIEIFKRRKAPNITPRGSPLWMAPEVIRGEYQGPESDVWSLGCTVIEMITGKPAWEDHGFNSLCRIANSDETPDLPTHLSELGKDFLDKCLRKDRNQRWSCDQLLQHPFVASASPPKTIAETSPRCVLDFGRSDFEDERNTLNFESSAGERMSKLANEGGVNWESDGWETVRRRRSCARETRANCEEGTSTEYWELIRTRLEIPKLCLDRSISSSSKSVDRRRQRDKYEGEGGVKSAIGGVRCGGYGSKKVVEFAVEKGLGLRFYRRICNLLLQLIFKILVYILLVIFNYFSAPLCPFLFFEIPEKGNSMNSPSHPQ